MKLNRKFLKLFLVFTLLFSSLFLVRLVFAADSFGLEGVAANVNLGSFDLRSGIIGIINLALSFLALVALIIVIVGGFIWMTSGGEVDKIDKAKKILKNGLIGLAIVLASWGIVIFLFSQFGDILGGNQANGCTEGATLACGCFGSGEMTCSGGAWGACLGFDCDGGGGNDPETCSDILLGICNPNPNICAAQDYCSDDCLCLPRGNLGDPCDGDLTNDTCEPDNNLCAAYLACGDDCTCFGPPVIAGISPTGGFCENDLNRVCDIDADCEDGGICNINSPNGAVNNFITIFGNNFGEYDVTNSGVFFNGSVPPFSLNRLGINPRDVNSACVNSWQDEQIIIAIPAGVVLGPIKVERFDGESDTTNEAPGPEIPNFQPNNIQRPGLCSLTPATGILEATTTYQGINLRDGSSYFGNYQVNVAALEPDFSAASGLTGTAKIPNIQSGRTSSFVAKTIGTHVQRSNYLNFKKQAEEGEGPYIMSFTPTSGPAGQYVTIQGDGFGNARGSSQVFFSKNEVDVEAAYDFPDICLDSVWRSNQIIVKVPSGLLEDNYLIKIKLSDGTVIDTQGFNPPFHYDAFGTPEPSLCKIEPNRGPIATPVSLFGEYFGNQGTQITAWFTRDKASDLGTTTKSGQADLLEVSVPLEAITGPVKVKNLGNSLNFTIGECQTDTDCGTGEVCCPASTYKKGRCEANLNSCFIDIPTSVFQWSFSTKFNFNTTFESCAGMAKSFGACQVNSFCPNVPGLCSPYGGGAEQVVGECDFTCNNVAGCSGNACTYKADKNRCEKTAGLCDLEQDLSYFLGAPPKTYTTTKTCNTQSHWEINVKTSCPTGWTRTSGNRCVDLNSVCNVCDTEFNCLISGASGKCFSETICPAGSTCKESNKCVSTDEARCDCCCRIANSAEDCCAPLTCSGTCGVDTEGPNTGLGSCSGCKIDNDPEVNDAACNCSGHTGQYCDTTDLNFTAGVCRDCSGLSGDSCKNHSSVCCLDANQTSDLEDDFCKGGESFEQDSNEINYGRCGYYDCQQFPLNTAECNPFPNLVGLYKNIPDCDLGCEQNPGGNHCSLFDNNPTACIDELDCCYDEPSGDCQSGDRIEGYCDYYDCDLIDPLVCDNEAKKTGHHPDFPTCQDNCAHPPGGAGLNCINQQVSDICDNVNCSFPGFACYTEEGGSGLYPDCGTCCCKPDPIPANDICVTTSTPNLRCLADKGNCSGTSRGLCCGCAEDSECGNEGTLGCGNDTCCQARPGMATTTPAHLANNVCRNAVIRASFSQLMDITSFSNNVLLLEERDYGGGVCPAGTFITKGNSVEEILAAANRGWLARIYNRIYLSFNRTLSYVKGLLNKQSALASVIPPGKLYCAVPGSISAENNQGQTDLIFSPLSLLNAGVKYYLVIKGDENLDSQSGILSLKGIGMNGRGYPNSNPPPSYTEGETFTFNGRSYRNSEIISFTTLSDKESKAGICEIDHIQVEPSSYLFQTAVNDQLQENDTSPNDSSFDTQADSDKVFSAWAYSADNQILQPVTGYFWYWDFVNDESIVETINIGDSPGVNRIFVRVKGGVTDAETKITATVKMDNVSGAGCDSSFGCTCEGDSECAVHKCCNAYLGGKDLAKDSDIYVFICNNPWPPVVNGSWAPFVDDDYGYELYYCRDAGDKVTIDDLPAINNSPATSTEPFGLSCSTDSSVCAPLNGYCGSDNNGDGFLDGKCIRNILKELYFFREPVPTLPTLMGVTDRATGGKVNLEWKSTSVDQPNYSSYKIYFSSQKNGLQEKIVAQASHCTFNNQTWACDYEMNNLENNIQYNFKVSVISNNGVESPLSNEKSVIPTDKEAPTQPIELGVEIIATTTVKLFPANYAVQANEDIIFRFYHGITSDKYGESFDSQLNTGSISLPLSYFTPGTHYFRVSAIDVYGNESALSTEKNITLP